jgi:hypothetical protein
VSVGRGVYIPPKEVPKFQEVGQDWLKTKREAIRASTLGI